VDPVELADFYACLDNAPVDFTPEFEEFATEVLRGSNFILPFTDDVSEALKLYIYLIEKIEEYS